MEPHRDLPSILCFYWNTSIPTKYRCVLFFCLYYFDIVFTNINISMKVMIVSNTNVQNNMYMMHIKYVSIIRLTSLEADHTCLFSFSCLLVYTIFYHLSSEQNKFLKFLHTFNYIYFSKIKKRSPTNSPLINLCFFSNFNKFCKCFWIRNC